MSCSKCVSIIHRVLCHQKKYRIKLAFDWKKLWSAMVVLVRYLLANMDGFLRQDHNVFAVMSQVDLGVGPNAETCVRCSCMLLARRPSMC